MVSGAEFVLGLVLCATTAPAVASDDGCRHFGHPSPRSDEPRPFPVAAEAQATASAAMAALRFFETLPLGNVTAALRGIRPPHISAEERASVLAILPKSGELVPDASERRKLAALAPVLLYHERDQTFALKVIDLPHAGVVLYDRAALLVSRPALRLLTAAELQAAVAHEIGHEYFWAEYEDTRLARSRAGRQTLELKCDGVAALTLRALALDVSRLSSAMRKVLEFNEALGASADAAGYPTVRERQTFVRTLLKATAGQRK